MKTFLLLGALLCSHVFAAGEGYVNFVRQTQQTTGVVWSMSVTPQGNAPSQGLLESGGALFQLWTVKQDTATDYLLDQKLVGAYMPTANITIQAMDSYQGVPRTRADKPFSVKINVGGLVSGTGVQDAAKRVLLEHHVKNYTTAQPSFTPAQATSGTPKSSASIYTNGPTDLNFAVTNLTGGADPTKVSGEEHFVVHALADGAYTQSKIAGAHVQVWAVTSGTISGIQPDEVIGSATPPLTVAIYDPYPGSGTYLQATSVKDPANPIRIVGGTWNQPIERSQPEKQLFPEDYEYAFPVDGDYVLELINESPFGKERLHSVPIRVDRKLEVRGLLGTLETE
jgi:hypothetical protein